MMRTLDFLVQLGNVASISLRLIYAPLRIEPRAGGGDAVSALMTVCCEFSDLDYQPV
jgi:hypothetical protein